MYDQVAQNKRRSAAIVIGFVLFTTLVLAVILWLLNLGFIGIGIAAWGARVVGAIGVARPSNGIDPYALSEPWRTFVMDARQAERRFTGVVKGTRVGPLRDRMADIGVTGFQLFVPGS